MPALCLALQLAVAFSATTSAFGLEGPIHAATTTGVALMQQAAPQAQGPVTVWVADAMDKVLRSATPPDAPPAEIVLEAARGEYESGQAVVRSAEAIAGLTATAGELKAEGGAVLAAANLRCRFVGYVNVERNTADTPPEELVAKAPALFPDPLLEDATIAVPAGQAQPVWLTAYIPPDTPPGRYQGAVRLTWQGGEATVPIRLTVWPFTVPAERHLFFTNWVGPEVIAKRYGVEVYSEAFWPVFERFVANAGAHRQNIMWVSPHVIGVFREADGKLAFDFAVFDRWVETLARHGVADLIEISQLGGFKTDWNGPEIVLSPWSVTDRASGKAETRPAEDVLPALLPALQEHLRGRGWLKRTVVHIADEPSVNNVRSWREKADWVHRLAPEIRRIDAIEGPDFGASLDVWVPKLSHYQNWQAAYEEARRRGAELWFYTCCHPMGRYPNRFTDYPLIKTRILHWLNWRYGFTGYLHWGLLFWTDDPFASAISGGLPPGDAWIVYPGREGPMDSIRWETLRDGIEDYEYLWVLTAAAERAKGELGAAAESFRPSALADELCREAAPTILDYTRQPARLREIRRRIAEEIIALEATPRLLVWTEPPEADTLVAAPAMAVLYVAAEPGTKVTVDGRDAALDERGFHAENLFLGPGAHEVKVTAARDGREKTVTRVIRVTG
jgi:hypothetical protein